MIYMLCLCLFGLGKCNEPLKDLERAFKTEPLAAPSPPAMASVVADKLDQQDVTSAANPRDQLLLIEAW